MTARPLFGRDIADLLGPQGPRRQDMAGFDPDYVDIVDYIIRCTHRIWEQKDLGLIETHYSDDCPIWLLSGPAAGKAGVIDGTTRTLSAFPDRTLIGDAVIWSGDAQTGYLSSHRITSTATNHGAGEFGPATGRRVQFLTIADCLCLENLIIEEWLVRDNSHIALQLGLNPAEIGRATTPSPTTTNWWADEIARVNRSQTTAFPTQNPPETPDELPQWFVNTILNHRRFAAIRSIYAPNATLHAPGGRRLWGHGEIIGWWTALFSCFGGARVTIDHTAIQPASANPEDGHDIAMRWSLAGKHTGPALYGPPSNRDLLVLGVTHWRFVGGRITREWTIFDEIAVHAQVYA
jgi:predicted ester cyclase